MAKTTFRDLIYDPRLGGGIRDDNQLKAFIPGGASAPWFGPDQVDMALDQDAVGKAGSMLGSGLGHRHGRHHLHGAGRVAHHPLLPPRVVRPVHALPGGRRLARQDHAPHRDRAPDGSPTSTFSSTSATTSPPGLSWPPQKTTICVLGPSIPSSITSAIKMFRDEFLVHIKEGGCPFG